MGSGLAKRRAVANLQLTKKRTKASRMKNVIKYTGYRSRCDYDYALLSNWKKDSLFIFFVSGIIKETSRNTCALSMLDKKSKKCKAVKKYPRFSQMKCSMKMATSSI